MRKNKNNSDNIYEALSNNNEFIYNKRPQNINLKKKLLDKNLDNINNNPKSKKDEYKPPIKNRNLSPPQRIKVINNNNINQTLDLYDEFFNGSNYLENEQQYNQTFRNKNKSQEKRKYFTRVQSKLSLEKHDTHNIQRTDISDFELNREIINQKTNKKINNRPFVKDISPINNEEKDYNKTFKKNELDIKKKLNDLKNLKKNINNIAKKSKPLNQKKGDKNINSNITYNKKTIKELEEENKNLKEKISKLEEDIKASNEKIKDLENKLNDKQKEIDSNCKIIEELIKDIDIKQNELNNNNFINETLKNELNNLKSVIPFKIQPSEKLMSVVFSSEDQNIHYSVICKNTDKFERIENLLYDEYPEYKKPNNCFKVDGNIINKKDTLEDNKIKDKSIIILQRIR